MTAVRVLQVGLGGWGRDWAWHVNPGVPEVDVVGYVDPDPASLALLGRRLPAARERSFASLGEAIATTRPEALLVTAGRPNHAGLVAAGIEAGVHVLVEKPFVSDLPTAESLVAAARDRNVVLMVSQNYRFFPAVRLVAELVASGSLGALYQVAIDFRRDSPLRRAGPARHHSDDQPLLVDMAVHHFDLLRMLLQHEPDTISCRAWNPAWSPFIGPSVAHAAITFGGAQVSYRGSWLSGGPATPWAGEWRMEFERGNVFWTSRGDRGTLADRVVLRERGKRPRQVSLPAVSRIDRWGTLTEFATAIREQREPETSGRDNLGTIAFMRAAVESAKQDVPIEVAPARPERALP